VVFNIGVGAGNFERCEGYFAQVSSSLPEKRSCDKCSPYKFSVALVHDSRLYQIAIDLKIENLILEIWFLIAQLKKYAWAGQEHC